MALPVLDAADIAAAFPGLTDIDAPLSGGQKVVFPCSMAGRRVALKVMLADPSATATAPAHPNVPAPDEVTARARREVAILGKCNSAHLVKLGPMPLSAVTIKGQSVICFAEEWIDGQSLKSIIQIAPLSVTDLRRLAVHMTLAIKELWSLSLVHRDIKPGNIMMRQDTQDYVLLDMGFALDLMDESITAYGFVPGTQIYLSPEQADFAKKRFLDFRSDLFSLGIVLYEAATGRHPFWSPGMASLTGVLRMLKDRPARPSSIRSDLTADMDNVIMRLLAKQPHLRYRSCDQLLGALGESPPGGN